MAAPEFVPVRPGPRDKAYESPPWRLGPWVPDRPAEVVDDLRQPSGPEFGVQGPDQGYALALARRFHGKLRLAAHEDEEDVIQGCVAVALRRASMYGRAPVIHDLRLAFALFGYLDDEPDPELVTYRRPLFEGLSHPHHYFELRRLANGIPEETLRLTPEQLLARRNEWRRLLGADQKR
ncbi:MAG TPA: hypothetical protein VF183_10380 [Acidimicrobiales bacterium]